MKPIVIAGNGPSLKDIDYTRLPKEFDVFRCNYFFLEDKYFLGNKITGYFFGNGIIQSLFNTSVALESKQEYFFQDRYLTAPLTDPIIYDPKFLTDFFSVEIACKIYIQNRQIARFINEYIITHSLFPTSGIIMIFTAIVLGYKEIYVTGIDFYLGEQTYVYEKDKNSILYQNDPESYSKDAYDLENHSREMDLNAIKLVLNMEEINIYAISLDSKLSTLLPLAPVQNDSPYIPEDKPEGYLKDIVLPFRQDQEKLLQEECERNQGIKQKIKNIFIKKDLVGEWEFIRQNSLVRFAYQTIKLPYIILKIIIKLIK